MNHQAKPWRLGYSVFAVRPIDEDNGATLPHTEADDIAMTLPQPTSASMTTRLSTNSNRAQTEFSQKISGLEDEDLELQAALQASLSNQDYNNIPITSTTTGIDDVAASMARDQARNRTIIERMQREQEMALRETYEDIRNFGETSNIGRRRTVGEAEEEEAIRHAIENSKADTGEPYTLENALELASDNLNPYNDRVYDDEDSELQAALRASLEGLPEGFVVPSTPPKSFDISSCLPDETSIDKEFVEMNDEAEPKLTEVDAQELRRRRLAKFGSGN